MPILNSFLGAQPLKTRTNKGFLNGGGGGLRCNLKHSQRRFRNLLNALLSIHTKQELQGKTFAFRYKENRRIGKNAYFDTC